MSCPECRDLTQLPSTGVAGLMSNTPLTRFINQAQKDKTTVVAGREVLKMSHEALTESELKCPEVVASIQEIASTAGHMVADNLQDHVQTHDLESQEMRLSIQEKTTQLQVKAMGIVHSIDTVNQELQEWEEKRLQIRDAIKHRSMEIQDSIRSIERRLISQLEDKATETKMKNEAFAVKNQLHKTLRSSLALVDFLRLAAEFAEGEELEKYSAMGTSREEKIIGKPVTLMDNFYEFDHPHVNLDDSLEMMFGNLSEVTEENVVWDPNKSVYPLEDATVPSEQTLGFSTQDYLRNDPTLLAQFYTEVNESTVTNADLEPPTDANDRLARRQFVSSLKSGARRPPMKSLSFDASSPTSPYSYITSENDKLIQSQVKSGDNSEVSGQASEFQILNENDDSKVAPVKHKHDSKTVHSAIHTLETSTATTQPYGGHQRSRRLSAPPSLLIESLNRRRLSALSILERANINTEGFHVSTDIETGMNEARMEWLREHVRRKVERSNSQDKENV